ncbi:MULTISPECIES: NAD(P)H-dependent oxidoreductase [unclassified Clostridium]|uniref:NAD(P)H-dependent oxidoreductase n=1 Tax=unclassified Clostridium TaxID=2614128 RepID=UPI0018988E53|nr:MULTISPECIES: NAD(P)H-dependent oxidoreductase [unclassified Clostridium]MCR1953080.1 NAD(P)H-dependent oxidoreductase [Clostridium sp. DSM 100503]
MNNTEILNALNNRFACKEFDKNKKIKDEDLNLILESGRLSPSSIGIEPWKFLVISNEELKNELATVALGGKKQIPSCSHLVILLNRTANDLKADSEYLTKLFNEDKHLPKEVADIMLKMIKDVNDNRFKNNEKEINHYSREQAYIALGTMLTTSALIGVDSCTIGGYDAEAVTKILNGRNLMDSNHFNISCMLALGYRNENPTAKTRRAFEDVVEFVK